MKTRKSTSTRGARRRRFLMQLLASLSIGCGASAMAETELAYYAAHPSEMKNKVRTVGGDDAGGYFSVLQVQAVQDPLEDAEISLPSSSDLPDEAFLLTPPEPLADPSTDDIDAVVDQAQDLPMPIQPLMDEDIELFAPLAAAPASSRPSLGAVAGAYASAPNMMGDFFGATYSYGSILGRTIALAGGDRRMKIAENTSPMPQDRVFFNYNHFHNALRDANDVTRNLDRYTFGLEKTFLGGMVSLETRLPFASGLNSTQSFRMTDSQSTELGNMAGTLKVIMLSGCDWLVSAGATLTLPTGDDFLLFNGSTPQLLVQNDAVHLAPFIGLLKVPNRDWFAQAFIQTDFDLNGNDVFTDNGFEGVLQDQHLLFIDASIGRWIHRSCDPCDRLSGIAAIAELHYTTTMKDTDSVAGVSNPFNRIDVLNATGALNFQMGQTSLRIGGAAPLRDDEDGMFDAEILVQLNRNY